MIRTHTIEGQRILEKIGGLMSSIGTVVAPATSATTATAIPIASPARRSRSRRRVIFCCDAYNAMTTDRPYRSAMAVEEALEELRVNSGSQFDPKVVEVVIAHIVRRHGILLPA